MRQIGALLFLLFAFMTPLQAYQDYSGGPIVVNGMELSTEDGLALMQVYGVIPAGEYWYDPVSGLWGQQGGPASGQITPGLPLGGALQADASGVGTNVFINGREIHALEYQLLLQRYGTVIPGRYWMNAQWIGGIEGGPASFNLQSGGGGNSGYNVNTYGGGLMSDGNCSAYLHPSGASVMTGDC